MRIYFRLEIKNTSIKEKRESIELKNTVGILYKKAPGKQLKFLKKMNGTII